MNEKREVILHYMDLAGMVTKDRNPGYATTKNGLMHLGFFITMLGELRMLDKHDVECFYETVKSCQDEDNPGAFDRYPAIDGHPRVQDPNAHDDARGVASGSQFANCEFHKLILKEGIRRFFYYDNTNGREPGLWAWRLRMVVDIMWYFLLNRKLRALHPVLMAIMFVKGLSSSVNYGKILDYMLVASLAKDSKVWTWFRRYYYIKRAKLVESTSAYFGTDHALVPIARKVCNI